MAVYRIFPIQDAALYSEYPNMNTGIDEILQVGNYTTAGGNVAVARSIIEFADKDILDAYSLIPIGKTYTASFGLYMAKVSNLATTTLIEAYLVTGSWSNGTGKYLDQPASYNTSSISNGITWNTLIGSGSLIASQSFGYRTNLDLTLKVNQAVDEWLKDPNTNNGLLLKLPDSIEFTGSNQNQPNFKYFSVDTNTIYPPYLEFKWDDSIYETSGSIYPIIGETDILCNIDNLGNYYPDSIQRFYVNCRPKYPVRRFTTASLYTQHYLMPSQSYYSIVDLKTNDIIVNFDETATKISVSPSASYFDFNMNGLQPERWYQVQIKTQISGSTLVLSNPNNTFKVINR